MSAEVVSTTYAEMVQEGREIAEIADNVVVKIPLIKDGIKAIKPLVRKVSKPIVPFVFLQLKRSLLLGQRIYHHFWVDLMI